MLGEELYLQPDSSRSPWILLTVNLNGKSRWEVSYANPGRIVRTEHADDGRAVLKEVQCNGRGTIIITYSRKTMPFLRFELLKHHARGASMRGLKHLCVEDLLERYFGGKGRANGANLDPHVLWNLFKSIGPLVPEEALEGKPL